MIRRFPNRATEQVNPCYLCFTQEKTRRSETSQYPEEKKEISIPLVAASEKGTA